MSYKIVDIKKAGLIGWVWEVLQSLAPDPPFRELTQRLRVRVQLVIFGNIAKYDRKSLLAENRVQNCDHIVRSLVSLVCNFLQLILMPKRKII